MQPILTLTQVLGNTCSEAGEKQQTWGPCQSQPHITFLLRCRTCQCTHKHAILVSVLVTPRAQA